MKPLQCVPPTNPKLNERSKEVAVADICSGEVQSLIDQMVKIAGGKGHGKDSRQMVGLAAVQVGVPKRVILIDTSADGSHKEQNLVVIINPQIITLSKQKEDGREGCWSTGKICGVVSRHISLTLEGYDRRGEPVTMDATGFTARIAQHEVDHLDGIRFPDRIPESEPEKLHTVEPEEFESYRKNWSTWTNLCHRGDWHKLKEPA